LFALSPLCFDLGTFLLKEAPFPFLAQEARFLLPVLLDSQDIADGNGVFLIIFCETYATPDRTRRGSRRWGGERGLGLGM
jgi:hypothetical protein